MTDAIANVIRGGAGATSSDDRLPVLIVERSALDGTDEGAPCGVEGEPVSPEAARRSTCDSRVDVLTLDQSVRPVSLNTVNRHANSKQRRALEAIIHHIIPWESKAESALIDLIPLCSRHHHMVHEGGWTLARSPDWIDRWAGPDGEVHERKPKPLPGLTTRAA